MPRAEAKMKFWNIRHKLDMAHMLQNADGKKRSNIDVSNPYHRTIGGVSVSVFKRNVDGNPKNNTQTIYINDPSQSSNAKSEYAPWSKGLEEVTYTKQIVRLLPEGGVKARGIFSSVAKEAFRVAGWMVAGAVFGIAVFYADKCAPLNGLVAKVFDETASKGIMMGSEQVAMGLGLIGGAIIAIPGTVFHVIGKIQMSFRGKMIKFIRDPANKDAVDALEGM